MERSMATRLPLIAGNWKMHTTSRSCRDLCLGVQGRTEPIAGVEKGVCPPVPYLSLATELLRGTSVKVGAQNVHGERQGALGGWGGGRRPPRPGARLRKAGATPG